MYVSGTNCEPSFFDHADVDSLRVFCGPLGVHLDHFRNQLFILTDVDRGRA